MTVEFLGNENPRRQELDVKPSYATPERPPEPPSVTERLAERAMFKAAHDHARHSLRRLGIPERDHADLVQEVVVAAYLRRSEYRAERGAPAAWLGGFLVNVARNYRRKRKRYERAMREAAPELAGHAAGSDEGGAVSEEHRRVLLEELLPQVPFEQRVVVVARDLDELEMSVIAAQQGIALSTAYDHYQRGRAALERAHARWLSQQKDRGLLLVPLGLEQLLDADRSIPTSPAEMYEAALRRFRRARPWASLRALLRRTALRSALTHAACGIVGAVLYATLTPREPSPSLILPLPPIVAAAAEAAPPDGVTSAAPSATVLMVASVSPASRPVPAPPARSSAGPMLPRAHAVPGAGEPMDEEQAFDAARRAFDRGELVAAIAALQTHERDFPRGALAAERELLWVKALVKSGRVEEARARLDHLRGTALARRMEALLPPREGGAASTR